MIVKNQTNKDIHLTIYNIIHIALMILLAATVILFITNSDLLLADNFFTKGIKFFANITIIKFFIIKFFIIKFSHSSPSADVYLSMDYLIFILLFINYYFVSIKYKGFCMVDAALQNQYHFSGVVAMHVYNKLIPSIAISGAFNKSRNKPATKDFDEFFN